MARHMLIVRHLGAMWSRAQNAKPISKYTLAGDTLTGELLMYGNAIPARATYGASYCSPRFATTSAPADAMGLPLKNRPPSIHDVPASLKKLIDVRSRNAG